ncbi:MAG TPA: hypothetical protein VHY08_10030 [Bacillota bacterium]|nr:hypothetical protein [Bacillota bacterium]
MEPELSWLRYRFELFGLSFAIFADEAPAIRMDIRTPATGYFAQTRGELALTVSFGPEADLDLGLQQWLSVNAQSYEPIQPRQTIDWNGKVADQLTLVIIPPPPAIGYRPGSNGPETILSGPVDPYRLTLIGTKHRDTPVMVTWKQPLSNESLYQQAEEYFFASFGFEE